MARAIRAWYGFRGAGCDGCAVSFLNSVHYATADDMLLNTLDVEFQSNLMAAAGDLAVSIAQGAAAQPGYILVVEGAIPTGAMGKYCYIWAGTTMQDALAQFAPNASYILALGACACYGGVTSGAPNPTTAQGVGEILTGDSRIINLPGCPAHPDWFVGTVTYLLTNGHAPPLDEHRRPVGVLRRAHPRELLQPPQVLWRADLRNGGWATRGVWSFWDARASTPTRTARFANGTATVPASTGSTGASELAAHVWGA